MMHRFFCCRSRNACRVEVDEVTDSLEKCLSVERGIHEFKSFLQRNKFEEEAKTLSFALKCQAILAETSRLSPSSRSLELPARIKNEITDLCEMAEHINFDLNQMDNLRNLYSSDVDKKISTLQLAHGWTLDLLQDVYRAFRARQLKTVV